MSMVGLGSVPVVGSCVVQRAGVRLFKTKFVISCFVILLVVLQFCIERSTVVRLR